MIAADGLPVNVADDLARARAAAERVQARLRALADAAEAFLLAETLVLSLGYGERMAKARADLAEAIAEARKA